MRLLSLLALLLAAGAAPAPAPGGNFLQMGRDAFEKGHYSKAVEFFFSELRSRPESIEAKTYITRIGEIWREAASRTETTPQERRRGLAVVHELLAARKRRLSQLDLDLREVQRQLEAGGSDSKGLLKASRSLTQFKELEPGDRVLAEQSKRFIELLQQQLRRAIQRGGAFENPKDLMVARGFLWYYKDELGRALQEWNKALALAPEDSLLAEQIRWVSRKKTLQERDETLQELNAQASGLAAAGKHEQALLYWRSLVIMEPENKRFQKSMLDSQQVVRKTKAERKLRAARRALRDDRLVDASQLFLEVVEIDPSSREALDELKKIQQKLRLRAERPAAAAGGEPAPAPRPERSPKRSEEHYTLGLIYYSQGESEKAKQALELALKHDPSNEKARNALARVQAELP